MQIHIKLVMVNITYFSKFSRFVGANIYQCQMVPKRGLASPLKQSSSWFKH